MPRPRNRSCAPKPTPGRRSALFTPIDPPPSAPRRHPRPQRRPRPPAHPHDRQRQPPPRHILNTPILSPTSPLASPQHLPLTPCCAAPASVRSPASTFLAPTKVPSSSVTIKPATLSRLSSASPIHPPAVALAGMPSYAGPAATRDALPALGKTSFPFSNAALPASKLSLRSVRTSSPRSKRLPIRRSSPPWGEA